MNAPERKVVYLAFCLLAIGLLVRVLPWGLPTIDRIQIEDAVPILEKVSAAAGTESFYADSIVTNKVIYEVVSSDSSSKKQKRSKQSKKAKKVALPLRINEASAEDLCALNGVGPKLAEKIVAHRNAFGPFKSSKDLEKVQGIGKKKMESILPGVNFD